MARAQDRGALQAAALFELSCVRFAGHPDLLRGWIAAHHLPQISQAQAPVFSAGHPALGSKDGGACRVLVEHG
jgi:hypothetical protein